MSGYRKMVREQQKTYVEVLIRHWAHLSPESSHFKLCLVVHLSDQLLAETEFPLKLRGLVTIQIWSLLR